MIRRAWSLGWRPNKEDRRAALLYTVLLVAIAASCWAWGVRSWWFFAYCAVTWVVLVLADARFDAKLWLERNEPVPYILIEREEDT